MSASTTGPTSPRSSFWHTTCSALQRGAAPDWDSVVDYQRPLGLLLRKYHWLPQPEREDLLQDLLIEIKERLPERYQPDRGPFRAFLQGVVRHRVLARWKRNKKMVPLMEWEEPEDTSEATGLALDLAAEVLAAVRRWHDQALSEGEREAVYVMAGRLVRQSSYKEIAQREGLSTRAVKRLISQARILILSDLLRRTLPTTEQHKAGVDWSRMAEVLRDILRKPGRRTSLLSRVAHEPLRLALDSWVDDFYQAMNELSAQDDADATELRHGFQEIFGV